MQRFKAHVKNGRLVLDEPTDLPEGDVVVLVAANDAMNNAERAALHESLERSVEQMKRGQVVDAATALAKLRAGQ